MPKYFFHVSDGQNEYEDREGARLPNEAAALDMARQIATDLADDGAYYDYWIVVRDENGNQLARQPVALRH